MNGKSKCKMLKEIRRQIAANNGIEYTVSECQFQGECKGTCPRCEEEVIYLEKQLEKRRRAGKAIAIVGVAAAVVAVGATSCAAVEEYLDNYFESEVLMGDVNPNEWK